MYTIKTRSNPGDTYTHTHSHAHAMDDDFHCKNQLQKTNLTILDCKLDIQLNADHRCAFVMASIKNRVPTLFIYFCSNCGWNLWRCFYFIGILGLLLLRMDSHAKIRRNQRTLTNVCPHAVASMCLHIVVRLVAFFPISIQ